jgi:hypothetical protein
MTLKKITRKDGKTLKMGRKKPVMKFRGHTLGEYLSKDKTTLPTPPASGSYAPAAATALAQMYGNDTLGDCVIGAWSTLRHCSGSGTISTTCPSCSDAASPNASHSSTTASSATASAATQSDSCI